MARQRRTFSTDFKSEAAHLVANQGYSIVNARTIYIDSAVIICWNERSYRCIK